MGSIHERVQEILDNFKAQLSDLDPDLSSEALTQEKWPTNIQRAVSCIHKHLFKPKLTVGWMKEQCHISGNNFSGKFKYYLGKTPKQYILHHRIEAAKQLLGNPKLQGVSISMTAYELGFSSAASFSRLFKRRIGITPSRWREKNL